MKHHSAILCLAGLLLANASAKTPRHPNVLYIMPDEWRYQATGYAGDSNARTPNIDQFAAESVNVHNAISSCPVCCPTRATLMTGQVPLKTGIFINDVPLKPQGKTLAEAFDDAGYVTGYIGKWHLYGSPQGIWERRTDFVPPDHRLGFQYWKANECSHDYYTSPYYEGDDPTEKFWPGYDADSQTTDACNFIKSHGKDQPFFLVLSWGPPHFPVNTAPAKYQEMYAHVPIQLRANVPKYLSRVATTDLRGYYAHIAALDECFGRLMRVLKDSGMADDTIVVFTSDHGDMMYSQGLIDKLLPWEESLRIPFLVRYPNGLGKKGRPSEVLLSTPDIMPTLLGLAHVPIPEGVQGFDYSSTSFQSASGSPDSAFLDMPVSSFTVKADGIAEYRGVRSERYTYVRSIKGPWLLYDNRSDPYQMKNRCGDPDFKDIQAKLEGQLRAWLVKLHDQFLPGQDYLRDHNLSQYIEAQWPTGSSVSPWGDWKSTMEHPASGLSSNSAITTLLANARAKEIMKRTTPRIPGNPVYTTRMGLMSPRIAQRLTPKEISIDQLDELDRELKAAGL